MKITPNSKTDGLWWINTLGMLNWYFLEGHFTGSIPFSLILKLLMFFWQFWIVICDRLFPVINYSWTDISFKISTTCLSWQWIIDKAMPCLYFVIIMLKVLGKSDREWVFLSTYALLQFSHNRFQNMSSWFGCLVWHFFQTLE